MTASPVDASTVQFNPETRLYIDGELRDSATGRTVDNINPATEEVLGTATDAGAEDMEQAIAAARRAFDTTDWSTNHEFRKRCLLEGLDDIGLTLEKAPSIAAYESAKGAQQPWL